MDMEQISSLLKVDQPWRQSSDDWWLDDTDLDVEKMAQSLLNLGARLATISAMAAADGETRLVYHWDVDGILINLGTITRDRKIPSIASICPAADWIEREVKDYFAITFTGREDQDPLVLRKSDLSGLFNWNGRRQEVE